VFIWHRQLGTELLVLSEHTMSVGYVAWNPVYHNEFATAGDDGNIMIWGGHNRGVNEEDSSTSLLETQSNGTSH
jgi:WD40 repeat protein